MLFIIVVILPGFAATPRAGHTPYINAGSFKKISPWSHKESDRRLKPPAHKAFRHLLLCYVAILLRKAKSRCHAQPQARPCVEEL
jgi:hypothetical protein